MLKSLPLPWSCTNKVLVEEEEEILTPEENNHTLQRISTYICNLIYVNLIKQL